MSEELEPTPVPNKTGKMLVVDPEMASMFFNDWADAMDLDLDANFMDDDEIREFNKLRRRMVKAISEGDLTFNENNEAVYTAAGNKKITFYECDGAALMAMDGKKKGHDIEKLYAAMDAATKSAKGTIANLKGKDLKVCMGIFNLLMG